MAADTKLPITGKDTRLELLSLGIPVKIADQVVNFSEKRRTSSIETKVIGTSDVYTDQTPEGWEGQIELALNSGGTDKLIDAYDAAQRAGLPMSLQIVTSTSYRDGTSGGHIYSDVKIEWERSVRRGQATTGRLSWKSGVARIAL